MDHDVIIDYNQLYHLIVDKLFKEGFPHSKTAFNFTDCYQSIDFDYLNEDDSYYFAKLIKVDIVSFVKLFIKQKGFIEDNFDSMLDTKLTDKGLLVVEQGGIENYKSYKERQEQLQLEIQKTTIETNRSIIKVNRIQKFTLIISMVVSVLALVLSGAAVYIAYMSHRDASELTKKNLQLQKMVVSHEKYEVDSALMKDKDTLHIK